MTVTSTPSFLASSNSGWGSGPGMVRSKYEFLKNDEYAAKKDISGNRMPSVADLLKQAAASDLAGASPKNSGPVAGQIRAAGPPGSVQGNPGKSNNASMIPQVVDIESIPERPEARAPGEVRQEGGLAVAGRGGEAQVAELIEERGQREQGQGDEGNGQGHQASPGALKAHSIRALDMTKGGA